jgi:hypothetical protein
MKFRTYEYWCKLQEFSADPEAVENYRRHLDSIADRVPADLLRVERQNALHDSVLRTAVVNMAEGRARLELDGDDGHGEYADIIIEYTEVKDFAILCDNRGAMGGPGGLGDLGYSEVHVVGRHLEHRLLFSTGTEIRILFEEIRMTGVADYS